ncbi:carbohydrate-binding module family 13 protein [Backusella circina FSU 941]|nr:carbohydrate-binding module family 13 protein [Backusella circina FSU 941]
MFPNDSYFILRSQKNGHVLYVDDSTKAGANVIVGPQDEEVIDSQLWTFDNGYLINKKSSLVMDIEGGDLKSDKKILQYDRKKTMAHNQRWGIRDGFIYAVADPRVVLDSKDGEEGTKILAAYKKLEENDSQLWAYELVQ